jgi:hypothetical protein
VGDSGFLKAGWLGEGDSGCEGCRAGTRFYRGRTGDVGEPEARRMSRNWSAPDCQDWPGCRTCSYSQPWALPFEPERVFPDVASAVSDCGPTIRRMPREGAVGAPSLVGETEDRDPWRSLDRAAGSLSWRVPTGFGGIAGLGGAPVSDSRKRLSSSSGSTVLVGTGVNGSLGRESEGSSDLAGVPVDCFFSPSFFNIGPNTTSSRNMIVPMSSMILALPWVRRWAERGAVAPSPVARSGAAQAALRAAAKPSAGISSLPCPGHTVSSPRVRCCCAWWYLRGCS